jgi:hypothetical protein
VSSYGTADLSRVDPADEGRWFTATYAPVLEWLARHYGQSPNVRWGLVWFGYEQCSAFLPMGGLASYLLGRPEQSVAYWSRLKQLVPTDWQVRSKLIQTYQALGRGLERDAEREGLFQLAA